MFLSIIICTHNRSSYLGKCLNSLFNQNIRDRCEVLVIDNASTDQTKKLILTFPQVKYFYEESLGLSHARNRGLKESQGEILAYLDDDALPEKGWGESLYEVFKDERVSCAGGPIKPIWEAPRPRWLHQNLECFLTILDYGKEAFFLEKKKNLFGANFAIRKNDLISLGGFNPLLGRKGKSLISGEEAFIQESLRRNKKKILYHPGIVVSHHVAKDRLEKKWFQERLFQEGLSNAIIEQQEKNYIWPMRFLLSLRKFASFLSSPRELLALTFPAKSPSLFNHRCLAQIRLGYICGMLKVAQRS
jgi:glycosyltransferase involved in cell wall biosynthesis